MSTSDYNHKSEFLPCQVFYLKNDEKRRIQSCFDLNTYGNICLISNISIVTNKDYGILWRGRVVVLNPALAYAPKRQLRRKSISLSVQVIFNNPLVINVHPEKKPWRV
jgi:hypothetical protein